MLETSNLKALMKQGNFDCCSFLGPWQVLYIFKKYNFKYLINKISNSEFIHNDEYYRNDRKS